MDADIVLDPKTRGVTNLKSFKPTELTFYLGDRNFKNIYTFFIKCYTMIIVTEKKQNKGMGRDSYIIAGKI